MISIPSSASSPYTLTFYVHVHIFQFPQLIVWGSVLMHWKYPEEYTFAIHTLANEFVFSNTLYIYGFRWNPPKHVDATWLYYKNIQNNNKYMYICTCTMQVNHIYVNCVLVNLSIINIDTLHHVHA